MTVPRDVQLFPYYKFTSCCEGTVIYFTGSLSIVSGNYYGYQGVSPYAGTGGSLQPNSCYLVESFISQTALSYPSAPPNIQLNPATGCDDVKCNDCNPLTCECPEGYELIDDECVQLVSIEATYSGELLEVVEGNKNNNYTAGGVRLYSDITSATFPILGTGTNNANYTVKDNNGAGATIAQIGSDVASNLWGSYAPCATGTSEGRLNTVGIWATNYPDDTELCFEYCVEPAATKQYLIGMAGDNAVRFYVDGTLIVNLDAPSGGTATIPYTRWHVFPITLTAGEHIIKVCGYNNEALAAFGAEIYDITLATFQANLLAPAVSPPNCGNVPADLTPYILFSTENMIGLEVPDPDDPGVWSCPDGYTLNECLGVPVCTIETRFTLICPCYLLIPCDGITPPFISNTSGLGNYVNQFVSVSYDDFDGCVYVVDQSDTSCENAVDVIIDGDITCDCDTICYYIEGAVGISYVQYIDGTDQLLQITPSTTQPWLILCSKILPIVGNTTNNYTITALGDCVDNDCQQKCFKLIDCEDSANILYSTSILLLPYQINGNVIQIANHTECWIVELVDEDCDCAIDVVVLESFDDCITCNPDPNYILTNCDDQNTIIYTSNDLSAYVGQVVELDPDCPGCWIVDLYPFPIPSDVSVTVSQAYDDCEACKTTYYQLTDCTDIENPIITSTDLSAYVGSIIILEWCPTTCWTVSVSLTSTGAGVLGDISNEFETCDDCLTSFPCVCSRLKNHDTVSHNYDYLDCNGDVQTISLLAGQRSERICMAHWLTSYLTDYVEYFGNCTLVDDVHTCPPPVYPRRSLKPGYNTPHCSTWKYEEISCKAAEALYKQVLELRYGISNCCPEEDQQYLIKKQLIDLKALVNPDYTCSTPSCGCNTGCGCGGSCGGSCSTCHS
jgi:hypothetical protein